MGNQKQIPDTPTRLPGRQILEESMFEEMESQGIDKCKILELTDKQEIERFVERETVGLPEMPVRIACEQETEECIEEEICDIGLYQKCIEQKKVYIKMNIKFETPKINAVEISEFPRDVQLEMSIEQSESKLMQDVILVSDVPTPFHADHEILLPNEDH